MKKIIGLHYHYKKNCLPLNILFSDTLNKACDKLVFEFIKQVNSNKYRFFESSSSKKNFLLDIHSNSKILFNNLLKEIKKDRPPNPQFNTDSKQLLLFKHYVSIKLNKSLLTTKTHRAFALSVRHCLWFDEPN